MAAPRYNLNDLNPKYRQQAERQLSNKTPVPVAHVQPRSSYEPLAKEKTARFNRPASIHVHSKRKRLADPDGCCAKYVIDALVDCGIFCDDSTEQIKQITSSQEQSKEEETLIYIYEH